MARLQANYYVRRVMYMREEFQVIDAKGNRMDYVDPEHGKGEFHSRQPKKEEMKVLEPLRILTETEAGLLGLPFEGERPPTSTPAYVEEF